MSKKFFIVILFSLVSTAFACAQKKEISQAKDWVKKGNNLVQAETNMQNLLKDSVNRCNEKVWLILFDAVRKQYEQDNEKLYLKQQSDTSKLFINARKMFLILEAFDSVEVANDKTPKYRKKHADYLNSYRANIYNGGMFFSKKQDYAKAFDFFDTYIDCHQQPIFTDIDFANDTKLSRASFMALYCGYKLADANKTLKYKDLAKSDAENLDLTLQYLAETFKSENDTASYIKTLNEGFIKYPKSMYFFPRLYDYHFKTGDMNTTLRLCDSALSSDSTNNVVLFAKSTVLLRQDKFDECIAICKKLIAKNDSLSGPNLNIGLAYYNQAVNMENSSKHSRKNRNAINALFKNALPFMQRYRQLAPSEVSKWALPLYTIYLNLNMGKEFDEIDNIIKKGNIQ